jgi:hypothetical protein
MIYAPTNQPLTLDGMTDLNPKKWYYVELQGTGASNHLGRVLLVLALGTGPQQRLGEGHDRHLQSENQFAALSLRPNGDVTMTLDADDG